MEAIFANIDYRSLCRFMILGLTFALNGCVYAFIPIIFYRPQFYCPSSEDESVWIPCTEEEGCSTGIFRADSEYWQINSISMEFNLYCDRKIIEASIVTIMAAGQILSFLVGTAVYIHPKKQYMYFIYGNFITGVCLILTYFATNPYVLIPVLFIWNTYYGLYMSVIFAHLNFFFSGALSKFGPSAFNTGLPAFLLLYCLFSYYYGYWKDSLVFFAGFPYIILTGLLIYFKPSPPPQRKPVPAPAVSVIAPVSIRSEVELKSLPRNVEVAPPQPINTAALKLSKENQQYDFSKRQKTVNLNADIPKRNRKASAALNQRLLDIDQHEIPFKAPAAVQVHQKKRQDENAKLESQNQLLVLPSAVILEEQSPKKEKKPEEPPKKIEESAWQDFKNQLKSIYEKDVYFKNVSLFVLCWLGTNIAYFGCLLVMGDLGGDIYTNVAFSTIFEFAGNLSATFLIIKFPERKILRIAFFVVGISYMFCLIFDPTAQEVGNGYSIAIIMSLIPIVIAKGTHEMLWTVLQTYLNTILPPEFHQFSFACSNLVSVIIMDILPFYKYLMEEFHLNQFAGYGLYCLFIAYIIKYFKDLYREDGKPIVSEEFVNDSEHPLNQNPTPLQQVPIDPTPNDIELQAIEQEKRDEALLQTI